ncbi:aminotransferase class V-fold PLP-dependent enzyme [Helicobacter sp. MIT 05-5293]|uniref:aminotransferase class V-fold PLP-dependent enzyme n=1 Tax=Helicobacter sp. MIT 05-5293 TaxID=1548149 RepID=UPI00051DB360|nr:aminotransferase class V-fold PLP-dependent enzyme [Helicobacter sp. MIT 05-5293]TLD82092.1 aminotransferase class V-fold PLP-dependent enzyme [Helicobacter sp. MIT 05-5293]
MIYLDNAATSFPKPQCVVDAVSNFLTHIGATPGRSAHSLSIQSGRLLYETRLALANFIKQEDERRIIFTSNATSAINAVLYGLLKPNDKVITTALEHNSVIRPLHTLSQRRNIRIHIIESSPFCEIDLDSLEQELKDARVLVCTYANNVTGAVLPIKTLRELTHQYGVLMVLDASQAIGSLEVLAAQADIICASCHKGLYAPSSLGFISLNPAFDEEMLDHFMQGGSGSRSENIEHPIELPDKYECGTPNMCAIAGLYAGIEWLNQQGLEKIHTSQMALWNQLYQGIFSLENIKIYDVCASHLATLAFNIEGFSPSEVGLRLDQEFGILTRVGLHCSPLTHKSIGSFALGGSVRISIGAFNTAEEIDKAIEAIAHIAHCLRR